MKGSVSKQVYFVCIDFNRIVVNLYYMGSVQQMVCLLIFPLDGVGVHRGEAAEMITINIILISLN